MYISNPFNRKKYSLVLSVLFAGLFCVHFATAEQVIPGPDWKDDYNPLASPDAEIGGVIKVGMSQYPQSFNYYLDTSVQASRIFGLMFETLLSSNPVTLESEPYLAEKCVISDDKKTFTFTINKKARWSDGKPVTAHDVAFTVETILKPENLTGPHKIGLEKFDKPEVLDDYTIRFVTNEVHWRNLLSLGSFQILPKHVLEGKDFNKVNFEFPVVSGLYRLDEIKEGVYARLKRRDDWWMADAKRSQGTGNFETIEMRFYAERQMMFEAFKKQEFDVHALYTSHIWVNKTTGEAFDKNWIVKQEIHNYNPSNLQGFAMNMRRKPYDDPKVRRALAHLLDRERMNEELMYRQYKMHTSYWEDLYDAQHPNPNPMIKFDKDKARALLKEAGWVVNAETGMLEKDGKPFVVTYLSRDASFDKFLVIYKEALADVGIGFEINRKDWAAWSKDMDEFNFDMTTMALGGTPFKDPESQWSSREADRTASINITGFKNAEVDALIDEQRGIFDVAKRNDILRKIDAILYEESPYALSWFIDYVRLLSWNKFGRPDAVLGKYEDESAAVTYWWIDPDSEADLEAAMDAGEALPEVEYKNVFDEQF